MPERSLSGRVAVAGVGTTRFGKLHGRDPYDLGIEAFRAAMEDAGIGRADIDGVIVSRIPDYQRLCEAVGMSPRYVAINPGQGRMSGASIAQAVMAIASGMCHTVALVYGNNGKTAGDCYGGETDRYGSGGAGQWFPYGMTSPGAVHAMMFNRHAHDYGTTPEQLAHVARTFRDHAALNPGAVLQERVTVEEILASRHICEPLHLFDYCLINDGGVALILTAGDRARDMAKPPVWIRGFSMATALKGSSMPPEDYWHAPMQACAKDLSAMTGLTPDDMDAFTIYDNFSPTVLFSLEGFGICPVGESGPFVAEGRLALGASHPTNTSGGHMSESYMQGWALNVEAVRQIRGECGDRQVPGCGLVQYVCAAPMVSGIVYGRDPA